MKVIHFLPHFPGREGTTSYCRGLCEAINEIAPDSVEIWSYKEKLADEPLTVLCFPEPRKHVFSLPKKLRETLKQRKDEISGMVLHGTFNPPMAAMGRFLRKQKIPYIFVPHDPYADELMSHGRLKKLVYWHLFEKRLISQSVGVVLLSESHRDVLEGMGFQGKAVVIANGCNPAVEYFRREIKDTNAPRIIQYLGRMDRNHKGLDLLISGFQKFVSKVEGKAPVLVLSGNDWLDRNELEKQVSDAGLTGQVVFTGARSESSAEIFSNADLAVLTSRFDGFGLTIVEAMLAGCPVLVTDTCGVSSHVREGNAGWVVKATAESISDGFEQAWRERAQWSERGARARKFVSTELTWKKSANESLKIYKNWFNEKEGKYLS